MGIIQQQTLRNTILSYIGLALGYINIIVLFQAFFTVEEYGLISLLAGSIAVVYAQLSALGLVNVMVRYFPFFRTDDKQHQGFITWVLLIGITGFIVITLIYLLLKPFIVDAFEENSSIYLSYFYYAIPIAFFLLTFNIFESITRAIHKTVFSVFLRDVLFRLLTTIGIFLVYFKIISFDFFVFYYVLCYALIAVLLLGQIIFSKEFKLSFEMDLIKPRIKEIINYGLFTLIAGSSYFIAQNVDKIMIGSMVSIEIVAVYSVFLYMATVISFPARSMYRIAIPIITEHWKNNDIKSISDLYTRISLILMIFGCILYLGILVNLDNIVTFLKPEYQIGGAFFVFLGLAVLADITGGVNADIISTSKFFKFDTLFNIIYLVLCVTLNYIFIPIYNGVGAAIATLLSMLIYNFMKWQFLKSKFGMQPFSKKNVLVILASAVTLAVGFGLPKVTPVADIIYRSAVISIVYFGLIIAFNVSEDINLKFQKYRKLLIKR